MPSTRWIEHARTCAVFVVECYPEVDWPAACRCPLCDELVALPVRGHPQHGAIPAGVNVVNRVRRRLVPRRLVGSDN